MDTARRIRAVLPPSTRITSLDFSDALHHIPIREADQVYLAFQVGDQRLCYGVLPFGLKTAPWAFTKVAHQVRRCAIEQGLRLFQYIDDWLNAALPPECPRELKLTTIRLVNMCISLGLEFNF